MEDFLDKLRSTVGYNAHCRQKVAVAQSSLPDIVRRDTVREYIRLSVFLVILRAHNVLRPHIAIIVHKFPSSLHSLELMVVKIGNSGTPDRIQARVTLHFQHFLIFVSSHHLDFIHLDVASHVHLLLLEPSRLLCRLSSPISVLVTLARVGNRPQNIVRTVQKHISDQILLVPLERIHAKASIVAVLAPDLLNILLQEAVTHPVIL